MRTRAMAAVMVAVLVVGACVGDNGQQSCLTPEPSDGCQPGEKLETPMELRGQWTIDFAHLGPTTDPDAGGICDAARSFVFCVGEDDVTVAEAPGCPVTSLGVQAARNTVQNFRSGYADVTLCDGSVVRLCYLDLSGGLGAESSIRGCDCSDNLIVYAGDPGIAKQAQCSAFE